MLKDSIQSRIQQAVEAIFNLKLDLSTIPVEHPTLETFGDYTSNIAMKLVKELQTDQNMSPIQIAQKIADYISNQNQVEFKKVEVAPPGFLNFTLSDSYLQTFLNQTKYQIDNRKSNQDKQILVEHTGPNTNKPLHIGHIRNATLGSAVLNLLHATGNKVVSANINNDRGIHIIKSMYGYLIYGRKDNMKPTDRSYKPILEQWLAEPNLWHTPDSQNMKSDQLVGYYYVLGNNDYEDSEKLAKENNTETDLNHPYNQMQQMLVEWEAEDKSIRALWQQNNDWFYQGMHQTLSEFGIKSPNDPSKFFDKEWYESQIYKEGKDIIIQKVGNGVIQEFEDGHIEAVLEKYNLPNVVLLRKNKTSLYITQDIELMRKRFKEDQNDTVIILTDSGQNLRFQQLYAICESLGIASRQDMVHIGYGTIRLPEGKMSSRKGTVIMADNLLSEVKDKAKEKINQERADYSEGDKQEISRQVAVAAIKYGMLKYNPLSNIVFDIESSLSFEGDTGPYLQYTHARASSIIRKYAEKFSSETVSDESTNTQFTSDEVALVRHLQKFTEKVQKSAESFSPNHLCEYLFILAQKFNLFYSNSHILNEENTSTRQMRLLITRRSQEILRDGLNLLGIEAPEKM